LQQDGFAAGGDLFRLFQRSRRAWNSAVGGSMHPVREADVIGIAELFQREPRAQETNGTNEASA